MFEYIEEGRQSHSLLIVRNGYLVTEAYFEPYDQATYHQMASMTKSVTGILVGIAIDRGHIKSADEPVTSFFDRRTIANLDARKRAITLQHLLSLTSVLSCMDKLGSDQEVQQSEDWVQFMLDLPMSDTPGLVSALHGRCAFPVCGAPRGDWHDRTGFCQRATLQAAWHRASALGAMGF
jgi:CubicO group peptidase (beta-lactamase class C family)